MTIGDGVGGRGGRARPPGRGHRRARLRGPAHQRRGRDRLPHRRHRPATGAPPRRSPGPAWSPSSRPSSPRASTPTPTRSPPPPRSPTTAPASRSSPACTSRARSSRRSGRARTTRSTCARPSPAWPRGCVDAGPVRTMTLAPELPGGLELIEQLAGAGMVVSCGHSDADAAHRPRRVRPRRPRDDPRAQRPPPLEAARPRPGRRGARAAGRDRAGDRGRRAPRRRSPPTRPSWRPAARFCLVTDAIEAAMLDAGEYRAGRPAGAHAATARCGCPTARWPAAC